ncbi:uncharacterized protein [Watersipora subatra]|uniref:uncharacterized protein n=1 Tax=Watersipora subatra TaxID=2589382 RepID=UPI00355BABC4
MYISELREMIPKHYLPSAKKALSNNGVLEQAVLYMRHLKEQADLFLSSNGTEAQRNEINRLKKELAVVSDERDKYEKMVHQAAAVTPSMLSNTLYKRVSASPDESKQQQITSGSSDRLLGQGLIITQSGQAYYVNEQGIPVAQGMAPVQLLSDNMIAKSAVPAVSVTSTSPQLLPAVSTNAPVTQTPASVENLSATGGVPNGLVALPGHSGQIPSAIILPNGQVIPVVSSNSTQPIESSSTQSTLSSSDLSSTVTTVTSTTVIASAPSSAELTCSSSTTAGVMLIGNQQGLSTNALHTTVDVSLNQLGRKIMPKPPMFEQMATSFTLAPLPIPACSVNVAPSLFSVDTESQKKRKTRKKKTKESDILVGKDVLATAAESLFSTSHDSPIPSQQDAASAAPVPSQTVTHSQVQMLPLVPNPLNGVRARRTKKRKIKEAKKASLPDEQKKPAKAAKSLKPVSKSPTTETTGTHLSLQKEEKCTAMEESNTEQSQAIEFDPNDLENILEQVENIEGIAPATESLSGILKEKESNIQSDYVLTVDEELGPVFTSSSPPAVTSTNQKADSLKVPDDNNSSISDSYLVGSLTKNTEQPVDHRRQNQKDPSSTKSVLDAYTGHCANESYSISRNSKKSEDYIEGIANRPSNSEQTKTVEQVLSQRPKPQDFSQYNSTDGAPVSTGTKDRRLSTSETVSSSAFALQSATPNHKGAKVNPSLQQQHSVEDNIQKDMVHGGTQSVCEASSIVTYPSYTNHIGMSAPLSRSTLNTPQTVQSAVISNHPTSTNSGVKPSISHQYHTSNFRYDSGNNSVPVATSPDSPRMVHRSSPCATSKSEPTKVSLSSDITNCSVLSSSPTNSFSSTLSFTNKDTSSHNFVPAWSPAKDAEKGLSNSMLSNPHLSNQSVTSFLPSSSYQQTFPHKQYPPLNETSALTKTGSSFQGDPYQYTQFTTSDSNQTLSDPLTTIYAQRNAQNHKFDASQSSAMLPPQICRSDTSQVLGRDSSIWSKVTPSTESVSAHDLSHSSITRESLPSPNTNPLLSTTHRPKTPSTQKSSRTKHTKESIDSSQRTNQGHQADQARLPPEAGYMQSNSIYGFSQNNAHSSRPHHIDSSNASTSKNSAFSAESILTKRKNSIERDKSLESQGQSVLGDGAANLHLDHRQLLQKDRNFMTSQGYAAPFNVNLFSSSASSITTLQSLPSHSKPAFPDPSFTFSLTSTSCPTVSASTYEKSAHSFHTQHTQRNTIHNFQSNSHSSGLHPSVPAEMPPQPLIHTYPNQFDLNPSNSHPGPPIAKPKQVKSHPDTAKDLSHAPYSFPGQSYGMSAFTGSQPHESGSANLFNPQPLHNNPSVSLALQFQHPAFPTLPNRSVNDFACHTPQMDAPARFNINNIFREKSPIDPFRLSGNNVVYPPAHSNIYPHHMGLFGGSSGLDINRAPSVAAFAASNPSLAGLRNPFDFNITGQR